MDAKTAAEMNGWLHRQILDQRATAEVFILRRNPSVGEAAPFYDERERPGLSRALDIIADCDSKIAVLEEHAAEWESYLDGDGIDRSSFECKTCQPPGTSDNWPCRTYLLVASAFRHKPGYKAEWAPESASQQG